MKRSILSILAFSSLFLVASCTNNAEEVEDAQQEVQEANEKLEKATREYEADLENYREEVRMRIQENEELIEALRHEKEDKNKAVQAARELEIEALEQRNKELKRKMDNYEANDRDGWQNFKNELRHDLDELGKTIKKIGSDNVEN